MFAPMPKQQDKQTMIILSIPFYLPLGFLLGVRHRMPTMVLLQISTMSAWLRSAAQAFI
jgi:hypothetical protein